MDFTPSPEPLREIAYASVQRQVIAQCPRPLVALDVGRGARYVALWQPPGAGWTAMTRHATLDEAVGLAVDAGGWLTHIVDLDGRCTHHTSLVGFITETRPWRKRRPAADAVETDVA